MNDRFPNCPFASRTDNPGIVDCARGGKPHVGVCANCEHNLTEERESGMSVCHFASPKGCCDVSCVHPSSDKKNSSVKESYCKQECEYRINPSKTAFDKDISAVIPAYNEDADRMKTTVLTMQNSLLPGTSLEIIILDDGSDEPVEIDRENVRVVRNEPGIGAMQSINKGIEMAEGEVITSWDSHMRVSYPGTFETLAWKALDENCLASLPSRGYDSEGGQMRGCYIYWNKRDGIQARWRNNADNDGEWVRIPAPMGADYAMSRETIELLKEPTGRVWENVKGRWGFGEQSMAIKFYLMGLPMYLCSHHPVGHYYRGTNPLDHSKLNTAKESWRNICFSTAALFSSERYERRFKPYVLQRLSPDEEEEEIVEEARLSDRPWDESRERKVFTHLLGYDSSITEIHPDHVWKKDAIEELREIEPDSVIIWRPNEILFDIIDEFPGCDIEVILLTQSPRVDNWVPILNNLGIHFQRVSWDKYVSDLSRGFEYDVALVCGERKEECKKAAHNIAKNVIVSPTNFRHQLEHGNRQDEVELVGDNRGEIEQPTEPTSDDYIPTLKKWVKEVKPDKALVWALDNRAKQLIERVGNTEVLGISPNDSMQTIEIPDYGPTDYSSYPVWGTDDKYDLIFIDGRRRVECLVASLTILEDDGIIILHDAGRKQYNHALNLFNVQERAFRGRTLILTPKEVFN